MNRAFMRGLLSELEKIAKAQAAQPAQQPQMMMMPAIPPEILAALMGEPEPQYEEPSMLQMLAPSLGFGAAGLGTAAALGLGVPALAKRYGAPLASAKANIAARMPSLNPLSWFGKRGDEKTAGMPFLTQDRPKKAKEIYASLKEKRPEMPAEVKARIAAKFGEPGVQRQGGEPKGPTYFQYTPKSRGGPKWARK